MPKPLDSTRKVRLNFTTKNITRSSAYSRESSHLTSGKNTVQMDKKVTYRLSLTYRTTAADN